MKYPKSKQNLHFLLTIQKNNSKLSTFLGHCLVFLHTHFPIHPSIFSSMEIVNMRRLIATIMLIFHVHGLLQEKNLSLIETTCRHTQNYKLCIHTLLANRGSIHANETGLGLIMVDAVKAKAKETLYQVYKLKAFRPKMRAALNQCTIQYKLILEIDVPVAVDSLNKGVPQYARDNMADSSLQAVFCEGNFHGESPITQLTNEVRDLCIVARDVIPVYL